MAGPGDQVAAGRGHLRASRADREQVIGTLKAAFVQGMLAKDEFDQRVDQTFAARTYAELAALTADLPAGLTTDPPRTQRDRPVLRPGPVLTAATALYAGAWASVLALSPQGGDNPSAFPLVFGGFILYLGILLICMGAILASQRDQRPGGPPPRPGRAGSFRRPVTVTGMPPKQSEAVVPARGGPAPRRHRQRPDLR